MVDKDFLDSFKKSVKKFKSDKDIIRKQLEKIVKNPLTGKPMRYSRKGTRELYFGSYRISYTYSKSEQLVTFVEVYHKDKQ